jgi:hypothetical protein
MRQTALPDISTNSDIFEPPAEYNDYPGTNMPPDCNTATIEGCSAAPKPVSLSGDNTTGSVSGDKVNGVFDLTGNATEWALDKMGAQQLTSAKLPWFCERPIDPESPCNPDENPADANGCAYVMGTIKGQTGVQRICLASSKLAITNGNVGITFGGNYDESSANDLTQSGIFSNVLQPEPNVGVNTVGFRCVGADSAILPVLDKTQTTTTSTTTMMNPDAGISMDAGFADTGTTSPSIDSGMVMMDAGTTTTADAGTSTSGADAGILD